MLEPLTGANAHEERTMMISSAYRIALPIVLLALSLSPVAVYSATGSGYVEAACDFPTSLHYTQKGVALMQQHSWNDAVYAFQAAADLTKKCKAGSVDAAWAYWLNVEIALGEYNLGNYDASLKLLGNAEEWTSSIREASESDANKSSLVWARKTAAFIRSAIQSARHPAAVAAAAPAQTSEPARSCRDSYAGYRSINILGNHYFQLLDSGESATAKRAYDALADAYTKEPSIGIGNDCDDETWLLLARANALMGIANYESGDRTSSTLKFVVTEISQYLYWAQKHSSMSLATQVSLQKLYYRANRYAQMDHIDETAVGLDDLRTKLSDAGITSDLASEPAMPDQPE